jgi:hypothetical protein
MNLRVSQDNGEFLSSWATGEVELGKSRGRCPWNGDGMDDTIPGGNNDVSLYNRVLIISSDHKVSYLTAWR